MYSLFFGLFAMKNKDVYMWDPEDRHKLHFAHLFDLLSLFVFVAGVKACH